MANYNALKYDKQLRFTGNAYLDANIQPRQTKAELLKIPYTTRFDGMEVVVLKDETMNNQTVRYMCMNGVWKPKNITIQGDDLEK